MSSIFENVWRLNGSITSFYRRLIHNVKSRHCFRLQCLQHYRPIRHPLSLANSNYPALLHRRVLFVRSNHSSAASDQERLPDTPNDSRILHNCLIRETASVGWSKWRREREMQPLQPNGMSSAFNHRSSSCISVEEMGKLDMNERIQASSCPEVLSFPYSDSSIAKIEFQSLPGQERSQQKEKHADNSVDDGTQSPLAVLLQERLRKMRQLALTEDYCGSRQEGELERSELWVLRYGSEDASIPVSDVVCSGCGAAFHCQNCGWPGFLPAEVMRQAIEHLKSSDSELCQLICQRCYFLRHHNTALHVQVTPNDYQRLMSRLNSDAAAEKTEGQRCRRSLVLLMVDLLDFPASIWPGVFDLIGRNNPVLIVGNKVDLLPADGANFLSRVEACLSSELMRHGFDRVNTKLVRLISARSGYGVEELISDIMYNWRDNGDIYLVGSTNVGKSTLFNALLQSDLCRSTEQDLIKRATVSQWPGTTLNMLKFPLLRTRGSHLTRRKERLQNEQRERLREQKLINQQLRTSKDSKLAMLSGYIGRTFGGSLAYNEKATCLETTELSHFQPLGGLSADDTRVPGNRWLYDTPGSVSENQMLDLLTQEELLMTLSRDLLRPRTFSVYRRQTVFIGGLARLDYDQGPSMIRLTVFASKHLPITVVDTANANAIYRQYLNSEIMVVPRGSAERMSRWPGIQPTQLLVDITADHLSLMRNNRNESCADIVLSSAGWVSVTPCPDWGEDQKNHTAIESLSDRTTDELSHCGRYPSQMTFTAHTPRAAGATVRQPALLPRAVLQRGRRQRPGPGHAPSKLYIPPAL